MSSLDPSAPTDQPAPPRRAVDHEEVVVAVRDVTRRVTRSTLSSAGTRPVEWAGTDTGLRTLFPVTYDVVLRPPQSEHSGQDDQPGCAG